tara:strand:+ start:614 stop:799 length:186 start_codon:yes stop_codon:yes gene_type:complete
MKLYDLKHLVTWTIITKSGIPFTEEKEWTTRAQAKTHIRLLRKNKDLYMIASKVIKKERTA